MSVAVRGLPGPTDPGLRRADRDPRHERLVVAAAVVATLAVLAGPLLIGFVGRFGPVEDELLLTPPAQRVLDELPGAFETDGVVVVPAGTDPALAWFEEVPADRVDGAVIELGVHGLADYGYLPLRDSAPAWLGSIASTDGVYSDSGPLSFACTRFVGAEECTGTLMMQREGRRFVFRSGIGLDELAEQPRVFRALDVSGPAQLVVGVAPPGTAWVEVWLAGEAHQRVTAHLSDPGAVAGATLWWTTVASAVDGVTFLDPEERVLDEVDAPY